MKLSQALIGLARSVGLEIQPAEKRGEVVVIFPREGRDPLTLRLSHKKTVELVLWMYVRTIKKEVEP